MRSDAALRESSVHYSSAPDAGYSAGFRQHVALRYAGRVSLNKQKGNLMSTRVVWWILASR